MGMGLCPRQMPRRWIWKCTTLHGCVLALASAGALLGLPYAWPPFAEEVCPGKHTGRESVLVVFSASACQGSVQGSHNAHQASPVFLMAQKSLNAIFSVPKVESIDSGQVLWSVAEFMPSSSPSREKAPQV